MPRKDEPRCPGSIDDSLDAGGIGVSEDDLAAAIRWDGGESGFCREVLDGNDPKSMPPSKLRRIE